jgi:hypothetical protein
MPRAKHSPRNKHSDVPEFRLDNLLNDFRKTHPDAFCASEVGLMHDGIHPSVDGWRLATEPRVWAWLTEKLNSAERSALVVAHFLIAEHDHVGAAEFLDWLTQLNVFNTPPKCPLAGIHLRTWLDGEQTSSKNRTGGGHDGKDSTKALWDRARREHPDWASGKHDRLPHGYAKELASEYHGSALFPAEDYEFDSFSQTIARALKRARKRSMAN